MKGGTCEQVESVRVGGAAAVPAVSSVTQNPESKTVSMDSLFASIARHMTTDSIATTALHVGWKLVNALIALVIGVLLIRFITSFTRTLLGRMVHDSTVRSYIYNAMRALLWVLLAIIILSVFGIETTALAALLGAAGLAVGLALQGTLSNFAAGFMLLLLRPFRAGDTIEAGGVTGKVEEIGIFSTVIDTPEHARAFVPNSAIFTGVIRNRSAHGFLRAEIRITLDPQADLAAADAIIRNVLNSNKLVLAHPHPDVQIVDDAANGVTLAARPYAKLENLENLRTQLAVCARPASPS
jgi:small conductance mechanosensitive channel